MHSITKILTLSAVATASLPRKRQAEIQAYDISQDQGADFHTCMAGQGFGKAVIRGYQQACGSGGQVDGSFLDSYNQARAAGLTVDSYFFPCTGTQPTGVACKPIQTQLDEYIGFINENNMLLETLWFDLEPTSGVCNAWNLGPAANEQLARDWVAALQATGLRWGVYANGNQWTTMFASRDTDVASSLPFWAVQFDEEPGVGTVDTFCGGWTSAVGKQYNLDTSHPTCGGSLDLNSFLASF